MVAMRGPPALVWIVTDLRALLFAIDWFGNYVRKCASGGQSLANAERGVGMCGFVGKIDTEFFITYVLLYKT